MKISRMSVRRQAVGVCLLAGLSTTTIMAPTASATPDCSPAALNNTVTSVTSSAHRYLDVHPEANAVVKAAENQPRAEAATNLRTYFTAHPQEYYDLRGILEPIGDIQRQCNTTALSPFWESAYNEFMAG
ncbi:heme-binding protein [Mycobacterium sp. Aquia_213]|uniref:heme-binding protein n=1 Tax=Mycobacterium sp. Aquia_213 TaxID=2991728 RepID=UPI003B63215B